MRQAHGVPSVEERLASPWLIWGIWIFWLFFLIQVVVSILQVAALGPKILDLLGIGIFISLYLWITWQEAHLLSQPVPAGNPMQRRMFLATALLATLATVLCWIQGPEALGSFMYVCACAVPQFKLREAIGVCAALLLWVFGLGLLTREPPGTVGQFLFLIPAIGTIVYFFSQAIHTNQELRVARREIARLAISEERLRFARDLHDLLGHSLSLITLKSELAGQLIAEDPDAAQREMRDIESAARSALREVREAVAGYRQTTLVDELARSRELLRAAGIGCEIRTEYTALPAAIEDMLTWVVREGITNVIRHSRAQNCAVAIAAVPGNHVILTIQDDGQGPLSSASESGPGNGLRGIRERIASVAGQCEAGRSSPRGFRLAIKLPLTAPIPLRMTPSQSVIGGERGSR